jgi:hypothetical protein
MAAEVQIFNRLERTFTEASLETSFAFLDNLPGSFYRVRLAVICMKPTGTIHSSIGSVSVNEGKTFE